MFTMEHKKSGRYGSMGTLPRACPRTSGRFAYEGLSLPDPPSYDGGGPVLVFGRKLDDKINPRTLCGKEVGKRTVFAINVNSQPKTI
jgi:hypothetical protein